MTKTFKIDGDKARLLKAAEDKLTDFNKRAEQEYKLLNDNMKETLYKVLDVSKEEGDKIYWNLNSKYYPEHGFYMAESEVDSMEGMFAEMTSPEPHITIN